MYKITTHILIVLALLLLNTKVINAQDFVVESSATLKSRQETKEFDFRVQNLRAYLQKYNSPLSEYAEDFVDYADAYGLDYRLVPAITGVESTFGIHIPYKSYNAYGWSNGEYKFSSWEDSISHVSMSLRTKYIDKGAATIPRIAKRYAPPSITWAGKVKNIMGKIDTLPLSYDI